MPAKSAQELALIAGNYVAEHFSGLKAAESARGTRPTVVGCSQAKTPGSPELRVYDYSGVGEGIAQRVRIVLDGEGKIVKVTTSH
jgi:hypothetical protein